MLWFTFVYANDKIKRTISICRKEVFRKMRSMSKFEKKFGKYTIKNISLALILCYICGYLIQMINPMFLSYLTLNPYEIVFHGQVWRLVSWIIVPPESFGLFTIIMLYFYYSLGMTLERTWGTYRMNVYLFSGMLFTVLGAFLVLGYAYLFQADVLAAFGAEAYFSVISVMFTTYYVNLSIFLAFASTFPDMQVLLFFLIPVKVKYMGVVYVGLLAWQFVMGMGDVLTVPLRVVIVASLLNFIVFYFTSRRRVRISPVQMKRRAEFKRETAKSVRSGRHECAVCKRTDETNPELDFRYCSKCEGSYAYCPDHLFTHTHVKKYE